jgi:flagellar basal-body rod protein FlgC
MDLFKSLNISAAGMRVRGARLRVISESLANANFTAQAPGEQPYHKKTITCETVLDRARGVDLAQVKRIGNDASPFGCRYQPAHPAADRDGHVLTANVNALIEMSDMREAQRSYEANLRVVQTTRGMLEQTIGILRG